MKNACFLGSGVKGMSVAFSLAFTFGAALAESSLLSRYLGNGGSGCVTSFPLDLGSDIGGRTGGFLAIESTKTIAVNVLARAKINPHAVADKHIIA